MRKILGFILVILVLLTVACSNSDKETEGAGNTNDDKVKESDELKPLSELEIGFSISTLTTEFFVAFYEGIEREAEALGVNIIYQNADGDPAKQLDQVEQLIARGVDAIILSPIDTNGIIPAVKKANEAGIPLVAFDRTATEGEVASFVRSDNNEMAEAAAQWLADQLKERYGEYKGNIVNLQGLMTSTPGQERDEGFQKVMEQYPDINVIATQPADFRQDKGFDQMLSIIQANQGVKIDGVFGANDENVLGALRAIKQQDLFYPVGDPDHIFLTGIDGSAQALEAIQNGEMDITASQHPIQSAEATVQLAVELIYGMETPTDIRWPFKIISIDNIDSKEVNEYGLWPYSLDDPNHGNVEIMDGLPIYDENGQVTGEYDELFEQIKE